MSLTLRGFLKGHDGWVTCLATSAEKPDTLISGSRDKSVMVWHLTHEQGTFGVPQRMMKGHSHYVQDVVVSSDGQFSLSASWDGTLRLWDLSNGTTTRRFVSHSKDVLSVAFSADNRQIVSGSRDKTIKLWNTLGECKFTTGDNGHSEWVSCVRFSPNVQKPTIVSAGWDKLIKVWDLSTFTLRTTLVGHTGYINAITISPDGSLCASAGKDGQVILWELTEEGKYLYSLPAGTVVNALAFSPNRYWLAAATNNGIKVWDLENQRPVADITKNFPGFTPDDVNALPHNAPKNPVALSLAWSVDGANLFAGFSDNLIRVFEVQN